ncbi:hypothetical protein [Pseudomonas sp. B21-048]|uniref:hypothetical protein n=1 Tax=Pseudomonas sp. B21-048 TaxID=2895490 RepID=UPI00215DDD47|nr:hypothetical protein [Pseudomonas sp. B21-048]UVK96881.1 hypothetical protein LOY56_15980 [Pseudomonas sp. B21-048]
MTDDHKKAALDAWYRFLREPEPGVDCEEHYDKLLKAADKLEGAGLINNAEWRELVRDARGAFSIGNEGAGNETMSG